MVLDNGANTFPEPWTTPSSDLRNNPNSVHASSSSSCSLPAMPAHNYADAGACPGRLFKKLTALSADGGNGFADSSARPIHPMLRPLVSEPVQRQEQAEEPPGPAAAVHLRSDGPLPASYGQGFREPSLSSMQASGCAQGPKQ